MALVMTAFCSLQRTRVHSPAPIWDSSQSPAASAPGDQTCGSYTDTHMNKIKNKKLKTCISEARHTCQLLNKAIPQCQAWQAPPVIPALNTEDGSNKHEASLGCTGSSRSAWASIEIPSQNNHTNTPARRRLPRVLIWETSGPGTNPFHTINHT